MRAAALLLAALLAGCATTTAPPGAPPTPTDQADHLAAVSAFEGAVAGIIVDAAIRPVAGAAVALHLPGADDSAVAATTTDGDGRFVFSLVEPGTYRVSAAGADLVAQFALIQVRAGATTDVTLILDRQPSQQPYLEVHVHRGLLECAFATVLFPTNGICSPGSLSSPNGMFVDVAPGFALLVAETFWDSPSEQVQIQVLRGNESGTQKLRNVWGGPGLRFEMWPGAYADDPEKPFYGGTLVPVPTSDKAWQLQLFTLYAGQLRDEINGTLGPYCVASGECAGVGVTTAFPYEQFATIFVHGIPPDFADYSIARDWS